MKQRRNLSLQQIVEFKIVELVPNYQLGLDWGFGQQVISLLVFVATIYFLDVKLREVCLVLELSCVKFLIDEVDYHVVICVVHIVVDDKLHTFQSQSTFSIKRNCFKIGALELFSLLGRRYHLVQATYFDFYVFFWQVLPVTLFRLLGLILLLYALLHFFISKLMLDQCHSLYLKPISLPIISIYICIHRGIYIIIFFWLDSIWSSHNGYILSK